MVESTLDRVVGGDAVARPVRPPEEWAPATLPPTLLLAAPDAAGLAGRLDTWIAEHGDGAARPPSIGDVPDGGPARLAVVDVTPRRLELARKVIAQGLPWRGRNGVWFEPRGLLGEGGRLAFVFPGVEPTFEPRVDDVAAHFGLDALAAPLRADGVSGLSSLERQSRGIIAVGRLLHRVLGELGVVPDIVAGHSLGEWSGELATGIVPAHLVDDFISGLRPGAVEVADVVFLALGCGVAVARELIDGLDRTVVSHDNCPQQSVVCGPAGEIATVIERCRTRSVMSQKLPFRSGFHSPLFAAHLPAFRAAFQALPLRPPAVPLWSATTCGPWPSDPAEMRRLSERHLVEPVRFRELVLALHDAGARVFVQVGVGTLTGFIDDTLRDREAVAIVANSPQRPGLEQLCVLAAALWVEGGRVAVDRLVARGAGQRPAVDRTLTWQQRFALDVEPAWADHALFRQPEGWRYAEDRFPLVPMTGIIEILMESASKLHPDLVPVAVEDVAAYRYLVVDPPTEATVRAATVGHGAAGSVRVKVSIDGHARATVVLACGYPAAPPADPAAALRNVRPSHIDADRLYVDRHMFHGPAYQGVHEFLALADNGSRAILRTPAAPGALLDNAGQVMGHWLSGHTDVGRLVLPTSIGRLDFFGPHPAPGTLVDCTVLVTRFDDQVLRADLDLLVDGRPWCAIHAWDDKRFSTDAVVFEALLWPERSCMSVERDGYTLVFERWTDSATRDLMMRRYLGRDERPAYERRHPLAQRQFLVGRVAVKDAVRRWLWGSGLGPLFPGEVVVANDHAGRPVARGPYDADLRVSLAHVEGAGVALVGEGVDVGIDIEKIEPRRPDFERLVLTSGELDLDPPDGYDRDTWLTCLWAVKEAAAKATGRGLAGRPKDFEICQRAGSTARVGDRWVAFDVVDVAPTDKPRREHVVAWTLTDR
jgi:malonyl CoA-acyl carrier protein transacylase/phosphopantetheinyl transferase (holo-ACP synthase)